LARVPQRASCTAFIPASSPSTAATGTFSFSPRWCSRALLLLLLRQRPMARRRPRSFPVAAPRAATSCFRPKSFSTAAPQHLKNRKKCQPARLPRLSYPHPRSVPAAALRSLRAKYFKRSARQNPKQKRARRQKSPRALLVSTPRSRQPLESRHRRRPATAVVRPPPLWPQAHPRRLFFVPSRRRLLDRALNRRARRALAPSSPRFGRTWRDS